MGYPILWGADRYLSQLDGYSNAVSMALMADCTTTATYEGTWSNSNTPKTTLGLKSTAGDFCAASFPCAKYDVASADTPAKNVGETFLKGKLTYTTASGAVGWMVVTNDATKASIAMLCGQKWRMDSLGAVTYKDDATKVCLAFSYSYKVGTVTKNRKCFFCDGEAATTSYMYFNKFVSPVY